MAEINGMKGDLVSQWPTNDEKDKEDQDSLGNGRNPCRYMGPPYTAPLIPSERAGTKAWPASVSRDEPEKLSENTRAHTFFVRTTRSGLMANIDVLGFIAKCPIAQDGEGVIVHRDVISSLAYHLLDKVHELEELRKNGKSDEPRYDEKLSKALDALGDRDAEIKELRAALGEAAVKIRRLETKIFK